jgi:hypothetical protein
LRLLHTTRKRPGMNAKLSMADTICCGHIRPVLFRPLSDVANNCFKVAGRTRREDHSVGVGHVRP